MGVHEQLDRVVAGFAVDLDELREVGRAVVVEPVVVREPGVRLRHGDEFTGARVVQVLGLLALVVEEFGDARKSVQGGAGRVEVLGAADVHVGDLVVGDREGAGGHRVEVLHAVLRVHLEESGAAQGPVDVHGPADRGDAVLGQRDDGAALGAGVVEERGQRPVQVGGGLQGARVVGAEALQVVVEMREVAKSQVGVPGGHDVTGGVDDPLAGDQVRAGAPEVEEGEGAELAGEFVVQGRGAGVAVGFLAAVGVVHGTGGDGVVGVGAHGVPPADVGDGVAGVGAAGGVPELVAGDESVVLAPQQDVAEFAEVPAVADDAVLGGHGAGEEGGLGGAGDGGQDGAERGAGPGLAELLEVGHVVEETGSEADDVQDEEGGGSVGGGGGGHGSSFRPRSVNRSRARVSSAAMPSVSWARARGRSSGGRACQV